MFTCFVIIIPYSSSVSLYVKQDVGLKKVYNGEITIKKRSGFLTRAAYMLTFFTYFFSKRKSSNGRLMSYSTVRLHRPMLQGFEMRIMQLAKVRNRISSL